MACCFPSTKEEKMITKLDLLSNLLVEEYAQKGLIISFCKKGENSQDPNATCHAQGKHSPIIEPAALEARFQKENPPFSCKFYSQTKMFEARSQFLEENWERMLAKQSRGETSHWAEVTMTEYAGCGIGRDGSIVHGVQTVTCGYKYEDGVWYEITLYPNAKKDSDKIYAGHR